MSDFYNKYPYTDFHELNLDWIIERVKQLTEDWLETKEAWENTEADWQELYDYVHDYFDNLNVQTEINNKIDAMILDGTFQQIATPIIQAKVAADLPGVVSDQIGSTVAGQIDSVVASQIDESVAGQIGNAVVNPVNDWLTNHITQPTTPAIDNTLTISGAAADAQKTGLLMANAYSSSSTYKVGEYVNYNGQIYRCVTAITSGEAWDSTKWTTCNFNGDMQRTHRMMGLYDSDLNYVSKPGVYYLGSGCTNYPANVSGVNNMTLICYNGSAAYGLYVIQEIYDNGMKQSWRRLVNASTHTPSTDWIMINDPFSIRGSYNSDLNNCDAPGTYYLGSSSTNGPANISLNNKTMLVFDGAGLSGNYTYQMIIYDTSLCYLSMINRTNHTRNMDWVAFESAPKSSITYCYTFDRVRKWFNNTAYDQTDLTDHISYAKYADYPYSSSGTTINIYGLMCKSSNAIYTAPQAFSASDTVNIGKSIAIDCPKSNTYNLYLLIPNAVQWGGTSDPRLKKSIVLSAGKHIISLKDMTADTAIPSGTVFSQVAINCDSIDNPTDAFDFALIENDYLTNTDTVTFTELFKTFPEAEAQTDILFWGDSLTAGAGGGGTTYCGVCASLLGLNYKNCGVGGETENTIAARQGGNNMIIPAGAVNGTYTLAQLKDMYGKEISPLRQGNGSNTVNPIMINGQSCTLSISQQSISDPNATYTISGYVGTTDYECEALFSGYSVYGDITVIFAGTNGYNSGYTVNERISVIKSMLSRINNKYVVMGLSIGNNTDMASDDAAMLNAFGNHFFPTRQMLVKYGLDIAGITPTAQDTTDIAAGTVPSSLRSDSTHLNGSGYTALGTMLASKIVNLGYADFV